MVSATWWRAISCYDGILGTHTVRAAFDAARPGGSITVIGVGSPGEQIPVSSYKALRTTVTVD
jgi:threonine dehydrogenase-like Zn-dependent dehydrogenase